MATITATALSALIVGLITTIIVDIVAVWSLAVSADILSQLMNTQFTSFNFILGFIPDFFGGIKTILPIIRGVAFALLTIVTIVAGVKSVAMSAASKAQSPVNIAMKTFTGGCLIMLYPKISSIFVGFLNGILDQLNIMFAHDLAFDLSFDAVKTFIWDDILMGAGQLTPTAICIIILIVACFITTLGAALAYVERYLSFAIFMFLGPICFAFLPDDETSSACKEWFKGLLSQAIGIFICLFALKLAGIWLNWIIHPETSVIQYEGFNIILKYAILVSLMTFVKNSEEFVNMLGFRTMPNRQTSAAFLGAMMATASGIRSISHTGVKVGKWGKDRIEPGFQGFIDRRRENQVQSNASKFGITNPKTMNGMNTSSYERQMAKKQDLNNFADSVYRQNIANSPLEHKKEDIENWTATNGKVAYNNLNKSFTEKYGSNLSKQEFETIKDRMNQRVDAQTKVLDDIRNGKQLNIDDVNTAYNLDSKNMNVTKAQTWAIPYTNPETNAVEFTHVGTIQGQKFDPVSEKTVDTTMYIKPSVTERQVKQMGFNGMNEYNATIDSAISNNIIMEKGGKLVGTGEGYAQASFETEYRINSEMSNRLSSFSKTNIDANQYSNYEDFKQNAPIELQTEFKNYNNEQMYSDFKANYDKQNHDVMVNLPDTYNEYKTWRNEQTYLTDAQGVSLNTSKDSELINKLNNDVAQIDKNINYYMKTSDYSPEFAKRNLNEQYTYSNNHDVNDPECVATAENSNLQVGNSYIREGGSTLHEAVFKKNNKNDESSSSENKKGK